MSLLHLLSIVLLYPIYATASGGFVAYGDYNCQEQKLDVWSDGVTVLDSTLRTDYSLKDWDSHAGGHYYENLTFSQTTSTNHTLDEPPIQVVWWKLQEVDPTCEYLIMKDTPRGWQVLNKLPGDEILRADREGCYYSALRPGDSLITSFCCGRDDCAVAEIEKKYEKSPGDSSTGDAPKCSVVKSSSYSSTPTIENGPQIGITRPQGCEAAPACIHSVTNSQSFSTAVANYHTYTWTTETGFQVSYDSGVNFLAEDKINLQLSYSISQAFAEETGTTITSGNISTTSEGSRQVPGTFVFYSFTPQYECWQADPIMANSGDAAGIFRMVYVSDGD
ncbi:hypothetical protein F5Y02DRAFT_421586 [Annulohypoxylon stygium]|nr:hypothetical protein F5Y02DRAFT_421586 [Annulohypoxylon stygium]